MAESIVYVALAIPIASFSLIAVLIYKSHVLGLTTVKYSLILPLVGALFTVLAQLFVLFEAYNYFMPSIGIKFIQYFNQYAQIILFSCTFLLFCCQCSNTFNLHRLYISHIITIQASMCFTLIVALTNTFEQKFSAMVICCAQVVFVLLYLLGQSFDVHHLNFNKIKRQIRYFMFKQKLNEDLQSQHLCHLQANGFEQESSEQVVSISRYPYLPRDFFPLCQGIPGFIIAFSVLLLLLGAGNLIAQSSLADIFDVAYDKIARYTSFKSETTQWAYNLVQAYNSLDLVNKLWYFMFASLEFVVVTMLTMYFTINSQPHVDDIFSNSILFELFTRWMYATDTQYIAYFLIDAMRLKNQQKIDFYYFDLFCMKYKALCKDGRLPLSALAVEQMNQNLEQLYQGYNSVSAYQYEDELYLVSIQRFEYYYKSIRQSKFSLINKVFYLGEMELSLYLCLLGRIFLYKDFNMYLYQIYNQTTRKEQFKALLFGRYRQKVARQLYFDYGALNDIYDFDYYLTKKNYVAEFYEHHKTLIHQLRAEGAVCSVLDFEFDANIFAYFYGVSDVFKRFSGVFDGRFASQGPEIASCGNHMILASVASIENLQNSVGYDGPDFVHFPYSSTETDSGRIFISQTQSNISRGNSSGACENDTFVCGNIGSSRSNLSADYRITYARQMSYFIAEIQQMLDQVPRTQPAAKAKSATTIGAATVMDHLRNQFSNYYCYKVRTPLPRGECVVRGVRYDFLNLERSCTMYQRKIAFYIEYIARDIQAREDTAPMLDLSLDTTAAPLSRNRSAEVIRSLDFANMGPPRAGGSEKCIKMEKLSSRGTGTLVPLINAPLVVRLGRGGSSDDSDSQSDSALESASESERKRAADMFSIIASRRLSLVGCERGNGNDQLFTRELYDNFNNQQFSTQQLDEVSDGNGLLLVLFIISQMQPLIDFPEPQLARFLLCLEIQKAVQPQFRLRVAWLIHKAYLLQRQLTNTMQMRKLRPHFIAACIGICGFHVASPSTALRKAYMYYRPEYCLAANTLGHIYAMFSKNESYRHFWAYSDSCVHYFMQDADFAQACSLIRKLSPSAAIQLPFFEFFYLFFIVHFAAQFEDILKAPEYNDWFYSICDFFGVDLYLVL